MVSILEINDDKVLLKYEDGENVDNIVKTSPSMAYNEFFENFLITNKPCVFDSDITKEWPSRRSWSRNNAPNFELLKERFGNDKVPVADCNKRVYNSQYKLDMTIGAYIDYWVDYRTCNYSNKKPLLYLKDWHCIKTHSNVTLYDVPKYFASDWLNEYYTAHPELNDDYMFVYMGPKGTWTPLHVDVLTSYSWSANIVGRKRWLLFPPGQENYLKDVDNDLIFDLTSAELNNTNNTNAFDNNHTYKSSRYIELIQEVGEIIFVPSGWYHQVWNLEDTISVNHNWVNGCNVHSIWNSLRRELSSVMKEIEDCRDMDGWIKHCQLMLNASFALNYIQFYEILSFIAERRLHSVINNVPIKSFGKWYFGKNHCLFDLRQIKDVLKSFIKDADEKGISTLLWKTNEAETLMNKINCITLD